MKIRLLSLMLFFIMTLSAQAAMVIVNVQGVSKDLTGMIRNNLSLISESAHGLPTDSRIEILYQQGQSEIQNTLKPYGYYKADISSSLQHTQKGDWLAIYRIMPGPRILITKTDIQIKGDSSNSALFNAMIQKNRIEVGKPLIHDNYTALKDDLLNKALSLGYFEAHYTASQIQIELKKNTAAVILHLQLGPRYTFGVIHFDQSAYAFDEAFLRRYLPFMTGAPFEASKVSDLQNALNNSNYFDNVIVNTRNNSENGTTDVDVKLHAKPAQEYTFGIGYGTETGPRALIGWKYRHTTSTGQYFTSQLQISSVYQDITASYVFPGANPVTDQFSINAGQHFTDLNVFNARDFLTGVAWTKTTGHFTRRIGLNEHWIQFSTQGQSSQSTYYLVPSVGLSYVNQVQDGYFKRGSSVLTTVQGALAGALSKQSFLQGLINARFSLPLSRSNRLLFSSQIGATHVNDLNALSPTYRFYAGGVDTVRGYEYYSLSPVDPLGNETGGKYLLVGSASFEQHLKGKLSGMVFYDIGNAFDQWTAPQLKQGAGVGLSYQSAVGPLTFYLARPLASSDDAWRIYFSVGWYI